LEIKKKNRSLASLGMTKSTFSARCKAVTYKDDLWEEFIAKMRL